jgi:hypothetical protein
MVSQICFRMSLEIEISFERQKSVCLYVDLL